MRKRSFTFNDMKTFASEAWGALGASAVDKWAEFNEAYFSGALRPIPLVITHTQPYGKRLAFCSCAEMHAERTITINVPRTPGAHGESYALLADNGVLLHEMVHQCLFERGEDPSHASDGWRREIMRLHKTITGHDIWAGRSKTMRDPANTQRVIRANEPSPTGKASLTQAEIATWPNSVGIEFGTLGSAQAAHYRKRQH